MNRMNYVCCATNHSQESANSPHSFCLSIPANMAEGELSELVVDNVSGKAGFPRDDAPRAVPSGARDDGWYGPEGRKIRHHMIFFGLRVAPPEYPVLPKSA